MKIKNLYKTLLFYPIIFALIFLLTEPYEGGGDGNLKYLIVIYPLLISLGLIILIWVLKYFRKPILMLVLSLLLFQILISDFSVFQLSDFTLRVSVINFISIVVSMSIFFIVSRRSR